MTNNNDKKIQFHEDESSTTKYLIHADFTIEGVVEKPDVVGALFGQTEGLLSDDLDLRELQKSGRVGRIQVNLIVRSGKTKGNISVPSSLDKVETSILAAAIETVDRIGPCNAKINIKRIQDVREEKRKKIIERASVLLKKWDSEVSQDSSEIHDEVIKAARVGSITTYGSLPAGPEFFDSDTIIIVEGRADIIACMKAGVSNTIAVQGAQVPKLVSDVTKKKTTIAFLDGDRGGDLILKELLMYADIDFVARAPTGKEVEDLKPKEIIEQLSKKIPIEKAGFISEIHAQDLLDKAIKRKMAKTSSRAKTESVKVQARPVETTQSKATPIKQTSSNNRTRSSSRSSSSRTPQRRDSRRSSPRDRTRKPPRRDPSPPENFVPLIKEIDGKEKSEGLFLDKNLKQIKKVEVSKIFDEIKKTKKDISSVVFDGVITQRLIDVCKEKNVETIIGAKIAELEIRPSSPKIYSFA